MLRYASRVRVKAGFYMGQIGTVFEQEERGTFTKYLVLFDGGGSFWFYNSEVEMVDGYSGLSRASL